MTRKRDWGHKARIRLTVLLASVLAAGCHTSGILKTESASARLLFKAIAAPLGRQCADPRARPAAQSEVSTQQCTQPLNRNPFGPLDDLAFQLDNSRARQLLINVAVVCSTIPRFSPQQGQYSYLYAAQAYRVIHDAHRDNPNSTLPGELAARQQDMATRLRQPAESGQPLQVAARLLRAAGSLNANPPGDYTLRLALETARVQRRLRQFSAAEGILTNLPQEMPEVKYERAALIIDSEDLARPAPSGLLGDNSGKEIALANAYAYLREFAQPTAEPYLIRRGPESLAIVSARLGDGAMMARPASAENVSSAIEYYDVARRAFERFDDQGGIAAMRIRKGQMYLRQAGLLGETDEAGFRCSGPATLRSVDLARIEFEAVLRSAAEQQVLKPVDAAWGLGCALTAQGNLLVAGNRSRANALPSLEGAVNEGFFVAVSRIEGGAQPNEMLLTRRQYYADYANALGELARAMFDARDARAPQVWQLAEAQWRRALDYARADDLADVGGNADRERHRYQTPILLAMARLYEAGADTFGARYNNRNLYEDALARVWQAVDASNKPRDDYPVNDRWPNAEAYLFRARLLLDRFPNAYPLGPGGRGVLASPGDAEVVRVNLRAVINDPRATPMMRAEAHHYLSEVEVRLRQKYLLEVLTGAQPVNEDTNWGNARLGTTHAYLAHDLNQTTPYRTQACLSSIIFRRTGTQDLSSCQADQARRDDDYAEALLRQGMFYMRQTFNSSGGEQSRAWGLARRSFEQGLENLSARPPSADFRVANQQTSPDMRLLLQYGRVMADHCAGMGGDEPFPPPRFRDAARVYLKWGIDNCAARR